MTTIKKGRFWRPLYELKLLSVFCWPVISLDSKRLYIMRNLFELRYMQH